MIKVFFCGSSQQGLSLELVVIIILKIQKMKARKRKKKPHYLQFAILHFYDAILIFIQASDLWVKFLTL